MIHVSIVITGKKASGKSAYSAFLNPILSMTLPEGASWRISTKQSEDSSDACIEFDGFVEPSRPGVFEEERVGVARSISYSWFRRMGVALGWGKSNG